MPSTLLNVLESIAHLLWVEPRETLSDGKLFLRFLGLDKQCQSADESWRLIRERIETVFGPKLLTWCQVGTAHRNARRQSSRVTLKPQTLFAEDDDQNEPSE